MAISHWQDVDLTCPACGVAMPVRLWMVIDAEEQPEAWDRCKRGDPHAFTCPNPQDQTVTVIPFPIVLHDGRRRFVIFSPPNAVNDADALQGDPMEAMLTTLRSQLGDPLPEYAHEPLYFPRSYLGTALRLKHPAGAVMAMPQVGSELKPVMRVLAQPTAPEGLAERIQILIEGLSHVDPEEQPTLWGVLQGDLGVCYRDLPGGDRRVNAENAIAAFREAAAAFHEERQALAWANGQINLGFTLLRFGVGNVERLEEAERAFQAAMRVCTQEGFPDRYAVLGAQRRLCQRAIGDAWLARGDAGDPEAFRRSLEPFTRLLDGSDDCLTPAQRVEVHRRLAYAHLRLSELDLRTHASPAAEHLVAALEQADPPAEPDVFAAIMDQALAVCRRGWMTATQQARAVGVCRNALRMLQSGSRAWGEVGLFLALFGPKEERAGVASELADQTPEGDGGRKAQLEIFLADHVGTGGTANAADEAIARLEGLLESLDPKSRRFERARALTVMGGLWLNHPGRVRGQNLENAIARFTEALQVTDAATDQDFCARTKRGLAAAYFVRHGGDKAENLERALALTQDELTVYTEEQHPVEWANVQCILAKILLERLRGDHAANVEEAVRALRRAATVFDRDPSTTDSIRVTGQLGLALLMKSAVEDAIECLLSVIARAAREEDLEYKIQAYHNLGVAWSQCQSGDSQQNVENAIEAFKAGLKLRGPPPAPIGADQFDLQGALLARDWATDHYSLGQAFLRRTRGDPSENLERAHQHTAEALRMVPPEAIGEYHRVYALQLAKIHGLKGDWESAYDVCLEARRTIDYTLRRATTDATRVQVAGVIDLLYTALVDAGLKCRPPMTRACFEHAEEGRARWLREDLTAWSKPVPAGLSDELVVGERFLRADYRQAQLFANFADDFPGRAFAGKAEQLREDLEALWQTMEKSGAREYVATLRGTAPGWEYFQAWLRRQRARCAIAEFVSFKDRLVMFVLRQNTAGPEAVEIALPEKALTRAAQQLRNEMRAPPKLGAREGWSEALQPLARAMLDRFAGTDLVYVSPHRALHLLPLHALADGNTVIAQKFMTAYVPSLATLMSIAERGADGREKNAFVVGNPTGDLPGAAREAEVAAAALGCRVLDENSATLDAVTQGLASATHAHLATHAFFNSDEPLESGLHLARGERLTARGILLSNLFSQRVPSFVFLSACETGVQEIRNGEDLIGMPRAFLFAGAALLVQSLWRMNDEAAVKLVRRFYQHLGPSGAGEALRLAMLETRAENPHSYFWAPLVTYGYAGLL